MRYQSIESFDLSLATWIHTNIWTKWIVWTFRMVSTLIKFIASKVIFASKARQIDLSSPYLPINLIPGHSLFIQKTKKLWSLKSRFVHMLWYCFPMKVTKEGVLWTTVMHFLGVSVQTFAVDTKLENLFLVFVHVDFQLFLKQFPFKFIFLVYHLINHFYRSMFSNSFYHFGWKTI